MAKLTPHIQKRADQLEAESPNAMVAVFEPTGAYRYASPSHLKLLGYTPDELLTMNLMQLISPQDLPHTQLGFMDAVLHGKSVALSVSLIAKSGRLVAVKAEAWHATDPDTGTDYIIGRATPTDLVKD